jgi:uncharacterized protein (DUF1800 family)
VGVDAGYTLRDVQEVARAFTGWTINFYNRDDGSFNYFADSFVYEDAGHDKGSKSIMGSLFIPAGGGMGDGKAVLDFLAQHPATGRFIARKLAQRFVADDPPQALVDRAAAVFQSTGGNLREVTRTILLSDEFLDPQYRRKKVKRPQHYLSSVGRVVGVADEQTFVQRVAAEAGLMGEDLYAAAPPTGYPETSPYWLGEGTYVFRVNLAVRACYGQVGFAPVSSTLAADPEALVDDLRLRLILGGARPTTIAHRRWRRQCSRAPSSWSTNGRGDRPCGRAGSC